MNKTTFPTTKTKIYTRIREKYPAKADLVIKKIENFLEDWKDDLPEKTPDGLTTPGDPYTSILYPYLAAYKALISESVDEDEAYGLLARLAV